MSQITYPHDPRLPQQDYQPAFKKYLPQPPTGAPVVPLGTPEFRQATKVRKDTKYNFFNDWRKTYGRMLKDYAKAGALGVADAYNSFMHNYAEPAGNAMWKLIAADTHNNILQNQMAFGKDKSPKTLDNLNKERITNTRNANNNINNIYYNIAMKRINNMLNLEHKLAYKEYPNAMWGWGPGWYRGYTKSTVESLPLYGTQTIPVGLGIKPIASYLLRKPLVNVPLQFASQLLVEPIIENGTLSLLSQGFDNMGQHSNIVQNPSK